MNLIVRDADWPHGLRCLDCDRLLEEGDAYSQRLVGVSEDRVIVEVVCVPCALGLAAV